MLCRITGSLFNSAGQKIKQGRLTIRLQQDIVSEEGYKVVPVTVTHSLEPLIPAFGLNSLTNLPDATAGPLVTPTGGGSLPARWYHYYVTAVDDDNGESLPSLVGSTAVGSQTLSPTWYNFVQWYPVTGASFYRIYGRGLDSSDFDMHNPAHNFLLATIPATQQYFNVGLARYLNYYIDDGSVNAGAQCSFIDTSGGFVDVSLLSTVGASPAGVAYFVEYDPDPADITVPPRTKDGYWNNYWTVPANPAASLGSFVSAERGQPYANYMPIGGSLATLNDNMIIGASPSNTNKSIRANQATFTPQIRFNAGSGHWEMSNDGLNFFIIQPQAIYTYIHTQASASTTWTVVHNKGIKGVSIVATTEDDDVIIPSGINYPDYNTAVLTFSSGRTGFAYAR